MDFNLGEFLNSSKRIFMVSKKPSWKEFKVMAKITGIGIIVIAMIGYIIFLAFYLTGLGK